MSPTRKTFIVIRSLTGLGSWFTPDASARFFGLNPEPSNRFAVKLFGARETALAVSMVIAPPSKLRQVALAGAVIDTVDTIGGLDEYRRGNLSKHALVFGVGGAAMLAAFGLAVALEAEPGSAA